MEEGWSSLSLEKYAAYRYGEDIPASTFRAFKSRSKIRTKAEKAQALWGEQIVPDHMVDVLGVRSELIQLQRQRIAIDVKHERDMSKLFGTTKAEIGALSALLDAHKKDLQDLGLMPIAGEHLHVHDDRPGPSSEEAPAAQTLGGLLGLADPEVEREMAKVLHMANRAAVNGKNHGEVAG